MNNVKNYILVHGAWHGKWVWERVVKGLQEIGHKVTAPDLPGHFQNKQDFNTITLRSYVNHIEGMVRKSQETVVLVGHSMAGVVVSQVAENLSDKVKHLVYISAFIPQDGGSLLDGLVVRRGSS